MDTRYTTLASPFQVLTLYRRLLPDSAHGQSVFTSPAVLYLHGIARYYGSLATAPPCTAGHVFATALYCNHTLVLAELSTLREAAIPVRPLLHQGETAAAQPLSALMDSLRAELRAARAYISCEVRDTVESYFAQVLRHDTLQAGLCALGAA